MIKNLAVAFALVLGLSACGHGLGEQISNDFDAGVEQFKHDANELKDVFDGDFEYDEKED
jgi:hypothetical protein